MAKYALSIGINNYPGTENDLSGCVNDAEDWSNELAERGFETELLLDREATKEAIVAKMSTLVERAARGDLVVITYSGHGTWEPDDDGDEPDFRDEALCPYDIAKGALMDDELYEIFGRCAAGARVVFISDSCHSGTVARFAPSRSPRKIKFMPLEAYERDSKRLARARRVEKAPARGKMRNSALLLAGCKDNEFSYDAAFEGRPNGAFTRAALNTLKTLGPDATYREWFARIRQHLPSMDYPQTPMLSASRAQKLWPVLS